MPSSALPSGMRIIVMQPHWSTCLISSSTEGSPGELDTTRVGSQVAESPLHFGSHDHVG